MMNSLVEMGLPDAAKHIEKESGVTCRPREVDVFNDAILSGDWEKALSLVPNLTWRKSRINDADVEARTPKDTRPSSSGVELATFVLLRHTYFEDILEGQTGDALLTLQERLSPLKTFQDEVQELSMLLLCQSRNDIQALTQWEGTVEDARAHIARQLEGMLAPAYCPPPGRLEHIVAQGLQHQRTESVYHNTFPPYHVTRGHPQHPPSPTDLFEDYSPTSEALPHRTTHLLEEHTDEVWVLRFSPCGSFLASGSDLHVIIWAVEYNDVRTVATKVEVAKKLAHQATPEHLSWNRDSSLLLTSCIDESDIYLWDVATGTLAHTFQYHTKGNVVAHWLGDSSMVASSSADGCLLVWDSSLPVRQEPREINPSVHSSSSSSKSPINYIAVTPDGRKVLALGNEKVVHMYDLDANTCHVVANEEGGNATSICMSNDGCSLLVNVKGKDTVQWNVYSKQRSGLFSGNAQARYVIRATFGGPDDDFVASGSEDRHVYIWTRRHHLPGSGKGEFDRGSLPLSAECPNGNLLLKLPGHTATVNSVSWSPTAPGVLASGSDDCSIRIWGALSSSGLPSG